MVRTIFAHPTPNRSGNSTGVLVDHLADLGMDMAADHLDGAGAEILASIRIPVGTPLVSKGLSAAGILGVSR